MGHLTIVDADTIAASNLHRQTPYTYADLGAAKAATADGAQCEAIAQTLDGEALLAALRTHDLAPDAPVLLICASGQRAQNTARTLRAQGYAQVYAYGKAWAEATTLGGS